MTSPRALRGSLSSRMDNPRVKKLEENDRRVTAHRAGSHVTVTNGKLDTACLGLAAASAG